MRCRPLLRENERVIRRVSEKLYAISKIIFYQNLFQIFTNFDHFWHKDGQDDKIM